MVYKFVQAYLKTHPAHFTYEKYSDLAAFGILSDMMLITELDNNYIIRKGLSNIKNKMILALLKSKLKLNQMNLRRQMILSITPTKRLKQN